MRGCKAGAIDRNHALQIITYTLGARQAVQADWFELIYAFMPRTEAHAARSDMRVECEKLLCSSLRVQHAQCMLNAQAAQRSGTQ